MGLGWSFSEVGDEAETEEEMEGGRDVTQLEEGEWGQDGGAGQVGRMVAPRVSVYLVVSSSMWQRDSEECVTGSSNQK